MARGEVARLCRVGEGKTSSGRNSGSSANRSSKYTSERTLPVQQTHTQNTEYMHTTLQHSPHKIITEALTHLSTESKVFFSGGGRALIFLGVGQSLSDCGGGRAGSVPDGGGRGEDGRDSFHPPYKKRSVQVIYMRTLISVWVHQLGCVVESDASLTSLDVVLSLLLVSEESALLEPSRGLSEDGSSSAGCADGDSVCTDGSGSKEK